MSAREQAGGANGEATARARPGSARVAALLLALHAGLALWVATRNSVTFDENFHVPAGVVAVTRADFVTSFAQPPLTRVAYGLAALAAGARVPDASAEGPGAERQLGEAFMRLNAGRYARVYLAARGVAVLVSVLLGWLLWRATRDAYGDAAGLVALALWSVSPEALAHGSLAGVDVPTALVFFGATLAGARALRTGRVRDGLTTAAWFAAAALVRFSAAQLFVILALLAAVFARRGAWAGPARTAALFAGLGAAAILAIEAGYAFQGVGVPLGRIALHSGAFTALAKRFSTLPSPLPAPYLMGLDYLTYLATPGLKVSYLLGQVRHAHQWNYVAVAIAAKWPIGLFVLLVARLARLVVRRDGDGTREATWLVPAAVVIGVATLTNLDYGVRYVLPALPFLCAWAAGVAAPAAGSPGRTTKGAAATGGGAWRAVAVAAVLLVAIESARALPYPLAFFNAFAGGPGGGDRIVNDSNVDWGQGLIALRDEMRRRGIGRVHLAYHGTTDPALYGIDYVPFTGGSPGPESDWLAVSSYFFVGLPARVVTRSGFTPDLRQFDMRPLWPRLPDARPAGCMLLYRIR